MFLFGGVGRWLAAFCKISSNRFNFCFFGGFLVSFICLLFARIISVLWFFSVALQIFVLAHWGGWSAVSSDSVTGLVLEKIYVQKLPLDFSFFPLTYFQSSTYPK